MKKSFLFSFFVTLIFSFRFVFAIADWTFLVYANADNDLPEFLALQEYYLIATGIHPQNDIVFLSDIYDFQKQIKDIKNDKSLFMACFSISESPPLLRDIVLPEIAKSIDYISIWYKDKWNEYNNVEYFSKWMKDNSNYIWECESYLPELFYLVGKKKG